MDIRVRPEGPVARVRYVTNLCWVCCRKAYKRYIFWQTLLEERNVRATENVADGEQHSIITVLARASAGVILLPSIAPLVVPTQYMLCLFVFFLFFARIACAKDHMLHRVCFSLSRMMGRILAFERTSDE